MEECLVKVVRSSTNLRMADFIEKYRLVLTKCKGTHLSRYFVYQMSDDYEEYRNPLGTVFMEAGVWVFVPIHSRRKHPELWYFGETRKDAISGYFQSIGQEVLPNEG